MGRITEEGDVVGGGSGKVEKIEIEYESELHWLKQLVGHAREKEGDSGPAANQCLIPTNGKELGGPWNFCLPWCEGYPLREGYLNQNHCCCVKQNIGYFNINNLSKIQVLVKVECKRISKPIVHLVQWGTTKGGNVYKQSIFKFSILDADIPVLF